MHKPVGQILFALLAAILTSLWVPPACGQVPLVLNELMASNGTTLADPQGQYDDWIEIYNGSGSPVDAGGLYLSDDAENPTRWRIPTNNPAITTVPAGGFLVIWADGDTAASGLHAGFSLDSDGDALYLFGADGVTLIDSVEFGKQIPDVSFGRSPNATGDWYMLNIATPGMSNTRPTQGVISHLRFSHERGFYDAAFDLTIACDTPGIAIYYTTDGSEPYLQGGRLPTGTLYSQPIRITRTTCLRAIAIRQDWVPSPVETHTYLFLADVALQSAQPAGFPSNWAGRSADYEMDPDILSKPQYSSQLKTSLLSLPSMSIVMTNRDLFDSQTGIYANSGSSGISWERPGSIELIYPDGAEGFQADCGVRIQGGYFRQPSACTKHSFRLLFKGIYGPTKLRYPLFGDDAAKEFDTVVLRAGANDGYAWGGNESNVQYTRDQFMRELQLGTGNAASHGRFVHLYVNGLYWGLYNPCERPDASFSTSYYGGQKEDWDVFRHKSFTLSQGERTALNNMLALCQEAGRSYEALMKLQGKGLDGERRPDYPCLLDLANYVDYMIVNVWGGNWDWPWNNYWLGRDRSAASTGFKFYCWDTEDVMLTSRSALNFNKMNDNFSTEVGQPHARLKDNAEYRMFFADRVHRLFFNGGILTTEALIARYTQMAAGIEQAMIPETARWADQHGSNVTQATWASMRDRILTTYLPQRTSIVLGHLRSAGLYPSVDAPVFQIDGNSQHGGRVSSSHSLTMEGGNAIYYTLDGTDPRVPTQTTSVGGSTSDILVAESAGKRVLVPTGPVANAWRGGEAFDDSTWAGGAGGVGYERSTGYEAFFTINLVDSMYGKQTTCLLRIPFTLSRDPATLGGVQLGVRYDDGFVAYLNGVEVARRNFTGEPVWNSAAQAQNSDVDAVNIENISLPDAQKYLKTGQNILAIQAMNQSTTSSDFLCSVMLVAGSNGSATPGGVSPGAIRYTGAITLSESACVKARAISGVTWSALNEAIFAVGPVAESLRISEIMYHPAGDPNAEFVELTNIGAESVNLNLVRFDKGISFTFPIFELPAGGYCLLVRDIAAFEAVYGNKLPVVGQYAGSLDNGGEQIELLDAAGQVIETFEYKDGWYDLTDGLGFSLTMRDPKAGDPANKNAWRSSALTGGSPGTDDSGLVPEPGSVVISEVLANPSSGASDWIELFNTTSRSIDLGGWFLSDDGNDLTKYEIAQGTSIPAGGHLVFTQNDHFGNTADPGCRKSFGLAKGGETVYLSSGSSGSLTGYSEQEKFEASETGVSMGRVLKSTGAGDFVALTERTPGQPNAGPVVGPIVITEIMYHPADLQDAEYVELLNISDAAVTLYDQEKQAPWRFTDDPEDPAIEIMFPSDPPVTLAPGQYLVLTKDLSLFNSKYAAPAGVRVLAWGIGRLTNGGEKVQLSRPFAVDEDGQIEWLRVDRVSYSDGSHPQDFVIGVDLWPAAADGQGKSLARIDPQAYGNDPQNWRASVPSPGWANP